MAHKVGPRPPFTWSQWTFPGFPTEYKFLHTYTLNIYSIRWQCCPSCHPSLNLTCCLCQLQLLPRSLTVMTLHLGLGRPNLWQQPGEQSLPSNCAASSHPCSLWPFCWQLSQFPVHLYNTFLAYESLTAFFPAIFLYHLYFPQSPCSKTNPRNTSLLLGQVFLPFSYRIPKATHPQVLIIYSLLPLIQSGHMNGTRAWKQMAPHPTLHKVSPGSNFVLFLLCPQHPATNQMGLGHVRRAGFGTTLEIHRYRQLWMSCIFLQLTRLLCLL